MVRVTTAVVTLLVGVTAMLAGASTAQAAEPVELASYPTCNIQLTDFWNRNFTWKMKAFPFWRSSTGAITPHCILGRGNTGDAVRALQASLAECNIPDPGPVDGIYGRRTEAAVRWIQWASGKTQDGIYGPDTRGAIYWRVENGANRRCMTWAEFTPGDPV